MMLSVRLAPLPPKKMRDTREEFEEAAPTVSRPAQVWMTVKGIGPLLLSSLMDRSGIAEMLGGDSLPVALKSPWTRGIRPNPSVGNEQQSPPMLEIKEI